MLRCNINTGSRKALAYFATRAISFPNEAGQRAQICVPEERLFFNRLGFCFQKFLPLFDFYGPSGTLGKSA